MANGADRHLKLSFNSPVVLLFSIISLIALILGYVTNNASTDLLFSVYRSSFESPLAYVRLVGHIFGHVDFEHFMGNITLLLVLGPMLEEKYGSANILLVILTTAIIIGIVHIIFFPNIQLLGASGVVFAFILLSSFASFQERTIPITFVLVAFIYLGGQIYDGIFIHDDVSHLTHILGGGVGSFLGYIMAKNKKTK